MARRSHFAPEARGGYPEEPPRARGQGLQLGGASTPEARAGSQEEHPEERWPCRHRRAKRSHLTLKVRNGGGKEIPLVPR